MRLLKNINDWTKFRRFRKPPLSVHPSSYPCYVYVEEMAEPERALKFLYPDDVFKMAMKMRAEIE